MNNKLLFNNNYSNNFTNQEFNNRINNHASNNFNPTKNFISSNDINKQLQIQSPEDFQKAKLNSELEKFNDDNYEFVDFKETVRTWLELDDDIKTLRKAAAERNKKKSKLTPKILDYMQKNKIYNINTQNGKIKCRKSIRTKSFNNNTLKNTLINYFQDVNKGIQSTKFLLYNKEKIEKYSLSRTISRKKKKEELNL